MFAGSKTGGTAAVRGCGSCLLWVVGIVLGLGALLAFWAASYGNESSKIVLVIVGVVAGCIAWGAVSLASAISDAPLPAPDPAKPDPQIVYVPIATPQTVPGAATTQRTNPPAPTPTQVIPPYSPYGKPVGFRLAVIDGPLTGRSFEIYGTCEVGRGTTAVDLTGDDKVSRYHALFVAEADCVRVWDSGSTNGTFINDQRVSAGEAHVGDIIRVGNTSMKVETSL